MHFDPMNCFIGFIAGAVFELLATMFLLWLGRKSAREINLKG